MNRFESIVAVGVHAVTWHRRDRAAFTWLTMTLFLLSARPVNAYTSVRVALGSNILVDGKRVIFAQGTGSLTVLDLETGEVLLRKKPEENFSYSGKLRHSAHGILMLDYETIALLDSRSFDPVWQASGCGGAVTDGEHIVSHDGNASVSCRKIRSGQVCWTVDMEGGWHLLAAKGKVLVNTPDHWRQRAAVLVLDVESGRKLLHHSARPDTRWLQVYFDGTLIYLVDEAEQGLDPMPGTLIVLDLQGKLVEKVDCNSPNVVPSTKKRWNGCFIWGDRYFSYDGRVQPISTHERKALVDSWRQAENLQDLPNGEFGRRGDYLPELLTHGIFASIPRQDALGETGQLFQMNTRKGLWKAYAPHLGKQGEVFQISETQGKLLLGSSEGQVECLDVETGRPRWLYVFPLIRQSVSYSVPHGMPPSLARQADAYWKGVANMNVSCGSIPLPRNLDVATANWSELRAAADYAGRIVVDPSPDDPFPNLKWYRITLAVCTSLPIIGVLLLLAQLIRRKATIQTVTEPSRGGKFASVALVICCLLLSIPPAYGLLQYGRVSPTWTPALKATYVMTILGALLGTGQLYFAKRWLAASLLCVILVVWVYLMLYPLWFA